MAPDDAPKYRSYGEVRHAVTRRILEADIKWGTGSMRQQEIDLVTRALTQNAGPVNARIAEALPHVVAGIRNPELYGEVLADAWALAKRPPGMDINAALEEMARAGGAPIRYIDANEGVMSGQVFFERYAGRPGSFIDQPLLDDNHGAMTHLVQDLVVTRALRRANQNLTSAEFRGLLGQAEGRVNKSAYQTAFDVFGSREDSMRTGDYVWRMVYDNTEPGQINRPEDLGKALRAAIGVR
jgi:hypothetical protein